ncbi:MAG: hypothetical protein JRG75_04845, partial [Deltaproteobacteria bacterium]|nr:hypothetical protein [Deltaproteobacteria bacterium]
GIAAKLFWDGVPPETNAFDPANALIFATGPLAGIPVIGGSRWVICGKSPVTTPHHFSQCNLGGNWGLKLKSEGYDAIMVQGRAERPSYLFLHDGTWELKDGSGIWGKGAIETRAIIKGELGNKIGVAAIGPAGENMAIMATVLADDDASGSGGFGAVMGSKNLKAVVVKRGGTKTQGADPDRLNELTTYFRSFGKEPVSAAGGMHLRITGPGTERAPCEGCLGSCLRRTYESKEGQKGKFMCQSAIVYQPYAEAYYGQANEVPFHATKLCDDYGLDTMALAVIMFWISRCVQSGILSDETTGMPVSKIGSLEFIETLVKKISLRDGFGDVLSQGVVKAARSVGPEALAQLVPIVSKAGQPNNYDARMYINTALLHATEPKPFNSQLQEITRIIFKWLEWRRKEARSYFSNEVARRVARIFWGSETAADFSTADGKALAAKMIQDRQYAKECLILCGFIWPVMDSEHTEDNIGDPDLEAEILSAVLGKKVTREELDTIGERVFNLQRAIYARDGHRGTEDDELPDSWYNIPIEWDMPNPEMLVPAIGDEAVSVKNAVVDKEKFEKMKREYYQLRQWDAATGLQTRVCLEALGLADIAEDLEHKGLVH